MNFKDDESFRKELLVNLKGNLPQLEELLASSSEEGEDLVYRFYHQSYKIYRLQDVTGEIVRELKKLLPRRKMNPWFLKILEKGTGKKFSPADNQNWTETTRPVLEAFFHARYFLEMAARYGKSLESAPEIMPSGWAALLYLYNLR